MIIHGIHFTAGRIVRATVNLVGIALVAALAWLGFFDDGDNNSGASPVTC